MNIDSYESPDAEGLLRSARTRYSDRRIARRDVITEAAAAAAFLLGAGLLAGLSTWTRSLSPATLAAVALTYLVATQVKFPVGSAWTAPTQLVFVPMLFVLPMPLVPLIVAACSIAGLWPLVAEGQFSLTRVFGRVADSAYSLGPAVVLVLTGSQDFAWGRWPLLLLAFGAQVAGDCTCGLTRTWFAERIRPSAQWPMAWLYLTDACLSCAAVAIAAAAVEHPVLVVLALPVVVLLSQFADERRQRLDQTLTLSTASRGTALLLGDVMDADDEYTGVHSREVVELALELADELHLDAIRRRNVEFTALLHDVGKIRVPSEIINKPAKLDAAEWEIMRRHTIYGEAMLTQVGGALARVGRFVRASHERFDSQGYPDGLAGDAIPIESRIVSVCDAYNAMTTDRCYRPAMPAVDAWAELRRCAGSQFDPDVVAAFERLSGEAALSRSRSELQQPSILDSFGSDSR